MVGLCDESAGNEPHTDGRSDRDGHLGNHRRSRFPSLQSDRGIRCHGSCDSGVHLPPISSAESRRAEELSRCIDEISIDSSNVLT